MNPKETKNQEETKRQEENKQKEKPDFPSLEDLNLIDNFLFGSVLTYPELNEKFSRKFLEIIFRRKFNRLIVHPQKVYYGSNLQYHGIQLDVYFEESLDDIEDIGVSTVYDIEPEKDGKRSSVKALPKRVRFYHTKIGSKCLKRGESYQNLKSVVIIVITPFDPFGLNRMVYTIKNSCVEEPDMPYDDGAMTMFLYTKGTKGNPPQELTQMLRYFENTTTENAVNSSLKEIDDIIWKVKHDEEVGIQYMKWREDGQEIYDRAFEDGQEAERANTLKAEQEAEQARQEAERARQEAEQARREAEQAKQEVESLRRKYAEHNIPVDEED